MGMLVWLPRTKRTFVRMLMWLLGAQRTPKNVSPPPPCVLHKRGKLVPQGQMHLSELPVPWETASSASP